MANTCDSVVRISGLKERLENFRSVHIVDGQIDVSVGLARYKADTGYEGSCCGLRLMDIDQHEYEDSSILPHLNLYIDSRWNEPHDWFRGIVSLHTDLTFDITWTQAADLFAGTMVASNGEITELSVRDEDQLTDDDYFIMGIERDEEVSDEGR